MKIAGTDGEWFESLQIVKSAHWIGSPWIPNQMSDVSDLRARTATSPHYVSLHRINLVAFAYYFWKSILKIKVRIWIWFAENRGMLVRSYSQGWRLMKIAGRAPLTHWHWSGRAFFSHMFTITSKTSNLIQEIGSELFLILFCCVREKSFLTFIGKAPRCLIRLVHFSRFFLLRTYVYRILLARCILDAN